MSKNTIRLAITGHRPNKLGNEWDGIGPISDAIRLRLENILRLQEHLNLVPILISGMALGVDMIWAELAIKNNLKLIAAIPCEGQSSVWGDTQKARYNAILTNPLCTIGYYYKGKYEPFVMQKRNEWMVDNCDQLVAVWDGSRGGTSNCIQYAKRVGRRIIFVNPKL